MAQLKNPDSENRTIELSFSSEDPYERFFGIEILDHGEKSVRSDWVASGRAPLLADHNPDDVIGVVEKAFIGTDLVGRAVVRFGKSVRAEEFFQDVKDGIRQNISVGYRIHKMVMEEKSEDEPDIFRVIDWEPLEVSLVSIPADQSVGIGRSQIGEEREIEIVNTTMEKTTMEKEVKQPDPAPKPEVDMAKVRLEVTNDERKRVTEIMALGSKHNMMEAANEYVNDGKNIGEFRSYILDNLDKKPAIQTSNASQELGLSEKEKQKFNFTKAVLAAADGDWSDAGFEMEVCEAARKAHSHRKFEGQLVVPIDILTTGKYHERAMTVGTDAQGGYLKGTEHMASSFIDLLRNKLLVLRLGARVMSGLVGDLSIPKQTAGGNAFWVDEGVDVTESTPGTGQVTLAPKTVGATVDLSRKLLLQSSPDAQGLVEESLSIDLATEIDLAVLKGSGTAGQPTGLKNTTGVGSVTIAAGAPTYANMVELETDVATSNADVGSLAYLMNANSREKLKTTEKAANTAQFIWENGQTPGEGIVNGYRAAVTQQLANDEYYFGNWADVIVGEWGVLDLRVDTVTLGRAGGIRINAHQDVDVAIRHPESFSVAGI